MTGTDAAAVWTAATPDEASSRLSASASRPRASPVRFRRTRPGPQRLTAQQVDRDRDVDPGPRGGRHQSEDDGVDQGAVTAVAARALPDGTPVIISGSLDETMRVWPLADGTPLGQPLFLPEWVRGIAVHGNIVITAAGTDIAVHQPALPPPIRYCKCRSANAAPGRTRPGAARRR